MVSCVPIIISQLDVCKNVGTNNMLHAQFFFQINSFNDGIMTHLKGEVIEKKEI